MCYLTFSHPSSIYTHLSSIYTHPSSIYTHPSTLTPPPSTLTPPPSPLYFISTEVRAAEQRALAFAHRLWTDRFLNADPELGNLLTIKVVAGLTYWLLNALSRHLMPYDVADLKGDVWCGVLYFVMSCHVMYCIVLYCIVLYCFASYRIVIYLLIEIQFSLQLSTASMPYYVTLSRHSKHGDLCYSL